MANLPKKTLSERLDEIGRDGSNHPISRARRAEEVGYAVLQDQYPDVDWALKHGEHKAGPDVIGSEGDQPYTAEIKLGRTRSANLAVALTSTVHTGKQGSAEYTHKWLHKRLRK